MKRKEAVVGALARKTKGYSETISIVLDDRALAQDSYYGYRSHEDRVAEAKAQGRPYAESFPTVRLAKSKGYLKDNMALVLTANASSYAIRFYGDDLIEQGVLNDDGSVNAEARERVLFKALNRLEWGVSTYGLLTPLGNYELLTDENDQPYTSVTDYVGDRLDAAIELHQMRRRQAIERHAKAEAERKVMENLRAQRDARVARDLQKVNAILAGSGAEFNPGERDIHFKTDDEGDDTVEVPIHVLATLAGKKVLV